MHRCGWFMALGVLSLGSSCYGFKAPFPSRRISSRPTASAMPLLVVHTGLGFRGLGFRVLGSCGMAST